MPDSGTQPEKAQPQLLPGRAALEPQQLRNQRQEGLGSRRWRKSMPSVRGSRGQRGEVGRQGGFSVPCSHEAPQSNRNILKAIPWGRSMVLWVSKDLDRSDAASGERTRWHGSHDVAGLTRSRSPPPMRNKRPCWRREWCLPLFLATFPPLRWPTTGPPTKRSIARHGRRLPVTFDRLTGCHPDSSLPIGTQQWLSCRRASCKGSEASLDRLASTLATHPLAHTSLEQGAIPCSAARAS